MKKIKLAVLALVFLLSSGMLCAIPVKAATTPSQSAAVSWAKSQVGKTIGGGSCVYLIYSYYTYLGRSVGGLNANQFINEPSAVPPGWTKLSSNFVPQPGDIAVWTPGLGNSNPTYGHVGIVITGNSSNFTVVDQNAPNPVCTTNTYPTSALACVIRPNFGEEIVPVSWATDTSRQTIGTTNATVAIKGTLYGLTNTSVTKAGVYLYDNTGKQIGSKTENFTAHSGDTYFLAWYNINTELGVTLSPGTKYQYKFMAVISGKTYYSPVMTFTTGGTHSHSYGTETVTKEPTCTTGGEKTKTCKTCGYVFTVPIVRLGHSYSDTWTVDKSATCTSEGSKSRHCTRCTAKAEVTAIPKLAHTYGEWKTITAATCTATGTKKRTCSCGAYETATITKTVHTYSSTWTVDKAATCTSEGSKSRHCTKCTAKTDVTVLSKTAHTYGDWRVQTAATVEKDGVEVRTCKNAGCSHSETRKIPKLPTETHVHHFGEWTQTVAPTCTTEGSMKRVCDCSAEQIQRLPTVAHTYGEWVLVLIPTTDREGKEERLCDHCPAKEERAVEKLAEESTEPTPSESEPFVETESSAETESTVDSEIPSSDETPSETSSVTGSQIDSKKEGGTVNYVTVAIIAVLCSLVGVGAGCGAILFLKKR